MVFKTTSTNRRRSRRAGFTLVEVMVAMGIAGLLMIVCLSLSLLTTRSIASLADSVDLEARSRHAIDRMSQKLRQAPLVTSFSPASIAVAFKGQTLTYTYDTNALTLVENDGGKLTTLLENCDNLKFALYKRSPVTNSFNQFPAVATLKEAKVIQVSWHCSRTLVSRKSGSAEMASARIVLRAK